MVSEYCRIEAVAVATAAAETGATAAAEIVTRSGDCDTAAEVDRKGMVLGAGA
jgi:hypothetical protein